MRTWITPVSLLANITVTMMVLGLLRKDRCVMDHPYLANITVPVRCDVYLDHPCLPTSQSPLLAKKGQV